MENGKEYTAPTLAKTPQDYPRLRIHCGKCKRPVDGYVLGEGVFNIYCHGDGVRWGVEDATGFEQYREGNAGPPLVVFDFPEH